MKKFENLPRINTNSPRETVVYSTDGLVVKRPGPHATNTDAWIAKQHHAQQVVQKLRATNNSTYVVPQMLQVSTDGPFAIEERIYGHPLNTSYVETLGADDLDIIYRGFANFVNDINQSRPVYTQAHTFESELDETGQPHIQLNTIIKQLKKYIPQKELKIVTQAKKLFDEASKSSSSVVFSHGDMNENNIFYDPDKKVLSIIDFADAKYETAHYMFNTDLARLGWLDIDRLIDEYLALPRTQPVIVKAEPMTEMLRNKLKNFVWSATEFLKNPKVAPATRIKIIRDSIKDVQKVYESMTRTAQFNSARDALNSVPGDVSVSAAIMSGQHQK